MLESRRRASCKLSMTSSGGEALRDAGMTVLIVERAVGGLEIDRPTSGRRACVAAGSAADIRVNPDVESIWA